MDDRFDGLHKDSDKDASRHAVLDVKEKKQAWQQILS